MQAAAAADAGERPVQEAADNEAVDGLLSFRIVMAHQMCSSPSWISRMNALLI